MHAQFATAFFQVAHHCLMNNLCVEYKVVQPTIVRFKLAPINVTVSFTVTSSTVTLFAANSRGVIGIWLLDEEGNTDYQNVFETILANKE